MNTKIFDQQAMLHRFGENKEISQNFFQKFVDSLDKYVAEFNLLIVNHDNEKLIKKLHELRGCSAYCSTLALYEICGKFENSLKNNELDDNSKQNYLLQTLSAIKNLQEYQVSW